MIHASKRPDGAPQQPGDGKFCRSADLSTSPCASCAADRILSLENVVSGRRAARALRFVRKKHSGLWRTPHQQKEC